MRKATLQQWIALLPSDYTIDLNYNERYSRNIDREVFNLVLRRDIDATCDAEITFTVDHEAKRVLGVSFIIHRLQRDNWYGGMRFLRGNKSLSLTHALTLLHNPTPRTSPLALLHAGQATEAEKLYVSFLRAERGYL